MSDRLKVYATPKNWVRTAISVGVSLVIGLGISVAYTNWVDRRSNQVWCTLINRLNVRYQNLPADADSDTKQFASDIAGIKKKYDC